MKLERAYEELQHHLPTASIVRGFAEDGGLISYSDNVADTFRRAAVFVDKILRGAKPGTSRSSTDNVRAGHQSQDRQGAWVEGSVICPRARGRNHPVI
jgi:hypothetical protein